MNMLRQSEVNRKRKPYANYELGSSESELSYESIRGTQEEDLAYSTFRKEV